MTTERKRKILYLITKSNWGGADLETVGFPTLARSSLAAFRHGEPPGSPTPSSVPPQFGRCGNNQVLL